MYAATAMSRLEDRIRCDGLRPDRRVCGFNVAANDPLMGWHRVVEEDLHICPGHLETVEQPHVRPGDSVLVLKGDGTLTHHAVARRNHVGDGVELEGGPAATPLRSLVVLAPHAGG